MIKQNHFPKTSNYANPEIKIQGMKNTTYGEIPSEWEVSLLKDICIKKIGVQTGPFGSQLHQKDYKQAGTPIITVEHLGENRIIHENLPLVSDEDRDRLSRYTLREGDTVFSRVGSVDRRAFVKKEEEGWLFSGRCLRVRPDPKFVDPSYLSWFFGNPNFKDYIRRIAVGATMPSLNTNLLESVEIILPPMDEQKKIAPILNSLNEKIDLNHQMNSNLEQIAQALFKRWFIDFEFPDENGNPYKSSGGKMVDSKLGEIPEGWEVKKIGDYLNTISKTYPLKTVSEVIFLNTGDIQNGKVLHSNKSTIETLPGQAKKSIQKDDILYSEIRPENKRFAYVFFDGKEHVVSTKLMVLRPIADIDSKFLYFILTQQNTIDFLQMMAESRSGTFPQITFNVISQVEFCGPKDNTIIRIFSKSILTPFMQERYSRDEENIRLSNIRDSLLPKLMSGKIRVQV